MAKIEFKDVDRSIVYDQIFLSFLWLTIVQRSPRSGFSFLPTPDGILLHGSSTIVGSASDPICKLGRWLLQRIRKRQRPIGVMLDDTWFLR